jgi:RimJ/RimL family protein N-acetyltransferase
MTNATPVARVRHACAVSDRSPHGLRDRAVALRALRHDDIAAYVAAFTDDPELAVLLGTDPPDAESLARRIDAPPQAGATAWAAVIADPDTDAFCGIVLLHHLEAEHARAEVGFWLVPAARRRGLAERAVALLIGWAFTELGLERIELTTTPDNQGAAALARKLGFTHEGVLRSRDVEHGRRVDIVWFGLLRDEWAWQP